MSELEKLFEAIGTRRVIIRRTGAEGPRPPGTWTARMCTDEGEVTGDGNTPAQAIRASLILVLARAQEVERAAEEAARAARDAVALVRNAVEGK